MKTNDEKLIERYRIKFGLRGTHYGLTGQKVKELRSMGFTYNEIQEIIGCSKGTISYHLSPKNGRF